PGAVIDQHFHNRNRLPRLQGVLKDHPDYLGIGIDESTAIVVHEGAATVVGKADVSVCLPTTDPDKPEVQELRDGARLELTALSRRVTPRVGAKPPERATAPDRRTALSRCPDLPAPRQAGPARGKPRAGPAWLVNALCRLRPRRV